MAGGRPDAIHGGAPEITNWSIALNCCEEDTSILRRPLLLGGGMAAALGMTSGRRSELIRDLDPIPCEAFNDLGPRSELGWIADNHGMRR
jgi:hypothetical protein